jgi:hypothetical protein
MIDLRIDSFREVQLSDRARLKAILDAGNKASCAFNYANLYAWGEINKTRWSLYRGRLFIYSGRYESLFMPVGDYLDVREMAGISDAFRRQGRSGNFILVDADYVENDGDLGGYFLPRLDEDNADYVYLTSKLYELKGNKLHKKKNLLSQFVRNNPDYVCMKMGQRHTKECYVLSEKWCKERNCEKLGFTHETSALRRALEHFDTLELEGLVIFVRGEMAAFSIFSRLNENTADVHFEKYDPERKGSAQAINWETARHLLGKYDYINREEDMGIEGLRRAKRSYLPEFKVNTYRLIRREGASV